LSNIARNAQASAAEVDVRVAEELVVAITDNGEGMDRDALTDGLRSVRDQVHALGGAFEVGGQSGGGTRIECRLPLSR
jgi:two-component system, NarL family, sensor histidine kinase DevS